MKLSIATSQFPVDRNLERNARYVRRQMREAKARGAHVVHFPEGALSGYAGSDFASYRGFDWALLRTLSEQILELAAELGLWTLLGSTHPLGGQHKPHNSVYVIDPRGRIADRYDKRFCSGDRAGRSGDLAHYSSGDHPCVFEIRGVRCGILICHDYRYPELYRDYKQRGVQLLFHSFHAGHLTKSRVRAQHRAVGRENLPFNPGTNLPEITMPATSISSAANTYLWISCSNTSARESCWPAFFVRPDGVVTGRLRRNTTGLLVSRVDTGARHYDSTVAWRDRSMKSRLHSGRLVRDARSRNRTTL